MKKFLFSFLFIFAIGAFSLAQQTPNAVAGLFVEDDAPKAVVPNEPITNTAPAPAQSTKPATRPAPVSKPKPTPTPTPTPTPIVIPTGRYKNGTYVGSAYDAYYGQVQVSATIAGGNLSDVTFLQYPNDRSTSREINAQAMTYLKQEALQAQSAKVSGVSGATDTSAAFKQSLDSALSQAAV